jgi:hypothetical protein
MSFDAYFIQHQDHLEDFWGRRGNIPQHCREFRLFDRLAHVSANQEAVLAAVDWAQPLYSSAPTRFRQPYRLQMVVRPAPIDPGPVPDDLIRYTQYTGHDRWLAIQYGPWGHCHIDLGTGRAVAVLTPALAERPDMVGQWLINTVMTNFLLSAGLGFLHATGLVRDNRALLLLAPHNHGKSTTALRLTMAGYAFVSDSQIYVMPGEAGLELAGFPVGRVKLRSDMAGRFPEFEALLRAEQIRQETKYVLDLHRLNPAWVCDTTFTPDQIDLCLLRRNGHQQTTFAPATRWK